MVDSSIQSTDMHNAERGPEWTARYAAPRSICPSRPLALAPPIGGVKTPAQVAGEARVFREQTTPALVRAAHLEGFLCGLICGVLLSWVLR